MSDRYSFPFYFWPLNSRCFADYSTNIVINMAGYRGIINSEMATAIVFNNMLLNRRELLASTVY